MVKVFIITQNEPFYIPKMVKLLVKEQKENYKIVGATILSPSRKNKTIRDWLKERIKIYTVFELFIVGVSFVLSKSINLILKRKSPYSNENILRGNDVELIQTDDINSVEYIAKLKALDLDIIISISCPQLFGSEILGTPKISCINAHGTLLPRHRGVFGSFWTLHDNDKFAGSTIHTMELKLDAGSIIWQKAFPVTANDTQFSIAYKTKRDMAFGLVEALSTINSTNKYDIVEPVFESSYHRAPTKEQAKNFRKLGRSIVKCKDLLLMLKRSF